MKKLMALQPGSWTQREREGERERESEGQREGRREREGERERGRRRAAPLELERLW